LIVISFLSFTFENLPSNQAPQCPSKRPGQFGRSAQRGDNRKQGGGGMPVAINHTPVAQVTAANTTPSMYLMKAQLSTSLMESEVIINISMFYIRSFFPLTISTNIAELTE